MTSIVSFESFPEEKKHQFPRLTRIIIKAIYVTVHFTDNFNCENTLIVFLSKIGWKDQKHTRRQKLSTTYILAETIFTVP